MKRKLSAVLAAITACAAVAVPASAEDAAAPISFKTQNALYAHAVSSEKETEAWVAWQCAHDDDLIDVEPNTKYFFMPSGSSETEADIYNAGSDTVTLNGTQIAPKETKTVSYTAGESYDVDFGGQNVSVTFLHSTAEAAIYVNNTDADGRGSDLMTYLTADKSLSAKATGAIVDSSGEVDNTAIKKIKGRGNTTWQKSKKPFNITYDSKVSIGGMAKSKKFSMLANYQDDSLSRNRFLYDLSDAVGIPYASDSRYVDFYVDGYYWGSYQCAEKIEVGSSCVVNDFEETAYLNEDGTVKEDFPFVCEIDPSAGSDDYTVSCSDGIKLTIKSPELSKGDVGYDEVKNYVKSKFNGFAYACANPANRVLSDYADIDSLTKVYLINELGKNWDSGVASCFFTYKQDENGVYKFYGSPVWDYDNSLGNAVGIKDDLKRFGVTDYEKYSGWWCMYKGRRKGSKTTSNIMANIAVNEYVTEAAPKIWFEEFVPALRHFSCEEFSETIDAELYTREKYRELAIGTAEMNYTSGWLLNTGDWIAKHESLDRATFDPSTGKYDVQDTRRIYAQTFEGQFDYCADWMYNRTSWLSSQMYEAYKAGGGIPGDVNGDGVVDSSDALAILRMSLDLEEISPLADINGDGVVDSSDALEALRMGIAG